jgi:tetratricopeptide (TPR) repeat protein
LVVAVSVACFFAGWLVVQDLPIRRMRTALKNGQWTEGVRLALAYLAEHPQDAEAWKLAGRCYGAMGQFGAAEECLGRAGDLDLIDLRLRADILIYLERNTQAVQVLRELLDKGDKDPAVLRGLAIMEFRRGFYEEAFAWARKMGEFSEQAPMAWYLQATFHSGTRNHTQALACLEKALELNPEADRCGLPPDTVLWYIGATLLDLGRHHEARDYFRRALKHAETTEIYWSLGEAEEGCGDLAATEEAWRTALKIDPNYGDAMFSLAKLALKQNRPEEAIGWLELVQRNGKQTLPVESALSRAYARLGRPDLAEEHSQRVTELQTEHETKAQEETLLARYPQSIHSRMLLTRRAIERGNTAEAAQLVEETLRDHPDNPQLLQLRQILNESK